MSANPLGGQLHAFRGRIAQGFLAFPNLQQKNKVTSVGSLSSIRVSLNDIPFLATPRNSKNPFPANPLGGQMHQHRLQQHDALLTATSEDHTIGVAESVR